MIAYRKLASVAAAALASAAVASPALADSYSCNDRGSRVYVSQRTIQRAARHAAENAAMAVAWAHYCHELYLED